MIKKIIKLFGIKIWEVDTYYSDDVKSTKGKVKYDGEVLEYTPEQEEKDNGLKETGTTN